LSKVLYIDNLLDFSQLPELSELDASAESHLRSAGGNFGNLAYVYGAKRILGESLHRVRWELGYSELRKQHDCVVMSCANQLGPHTDLGNLANHLENLGLPVVLLGIGAQSTNFGSLPELTQGTRDFLRVVKNLRNSSHPNISTRGEFTSEILDRLGLDSVSTGCPSLFINGRKNLGEEIVLSQEKAIGPKRISCLGGNPFSNHSGIEITLKEIVNKFKGEYIVQHPLLMAQACQGEWNLIDEKKRKRLIDTFGFTSQAEMYGWFKSNTSYFTDLAAWVRYYKKFDYALGPRYHGVALSCQAGIPGLVITIDSRTQELAESTGIKYISMKKALEMSGDELSQFAEWDESNGQVFDSKREINAALFSNFLNQNGLRASKHLLSFYNKTSL